MKFITYMVLFEDGYLYTGSTGNLTRRNKDRKRKFGGGFRVVFREAFGTREEALAREKQLKGWKRAKKEALFEERRADLVVLAKRRSGDLLERPI